MNKWNAAGYERHAGFVAELGAPLLDLLQPGPGERVLDLGCGDGRLTARVAGEERRVVGLDRSLSQAAATFGRAVPAVCADARFLPFAAGTFDAVLSNAALHWVPDHPRALAAVRRVLVPGGRLVAELGAAGNVDTIRQVLHRVVADHGVDPVPCDPWYFPTAGEYRELLHAAGFGLTEMAVINRPTLLPTGIDGWLATFAGPFLGSFDPAEKAAVVAEVRDRLAPRLVDGRGRWIADYVRLRFRALAV
jgi:SAM-dependent methyltransferase